MGNRLRSQKHLDGKLADFSVADAQSFKTPIWSNGDRLGGR
jgi:hypothetical protein